MIFRISISFCFLFFCFLFFCFLFLVQGVSKADYIASVNEDINTTIFIQSASNGQLVNTINTNYFAPPTGLGLAADIENGYFYYKGEEGSLGRIGFDGSNETSFRVRGGPGTIDGANTDALGFHQQSGVLYGTFANQLLRFDYLGAGFINYELTPVATFNDNNQISLEGFDIDPDTGRMFAVDDFNDRVLELFFDGTFSVVAPFPETPRDIDGLAVGGGEIFLIEDGVDDPFTVIDIETGAVKRTFDSPYTGNGGTSGGVYFRSNSIPEPSTAVILLFALPALFRRKQKNN